MEEPVLDEETMSRLERFGREMERIRFAEYVEYTNSPRRIIYTNFLAGLARGFGMAIGFSMLAAAFVMFLRRLILLNLPLIHDFLEQLLNMATGNI
jgi:hypothetical protein